MFAYRFWNLSTFLLLFFIFSANVRLFQFFQLHPNQRSNADPSRDDEPCGENAERIACRKSLHEPKVTCERMRNCQDVIDLYKNEGTSLDFIGESQPQQGHGQDPLSHSQRPSFGHHALNFVPDLNPFIPHVFPTNQGQGRGGQGQRRQRQRGQGGRGKGPEMINDCHCKRDFFFVTRGADDCIQAEDCLDNASYPAIWIFALTWPGSLQWDISRKPIGGLRGRWSIHGLWPDRSNGASIMDCNTTMTMNDLNAMLTTANLRSKLKDRLNDCWCPKSPRKQNRVAFWTKEWNKHGSCSRMSQVPYFAFAYALYERFEISNLLRGNRVHRIWPNNDTPVTVGQFSDAMAEALPGISKGQFLLACSEATLAGKGKVQLLTEFRLCFTAHTPRQWTDCPPKAVLCEDSFYYLKNNNKLQKSG